MNEDFNKLKRLRILYRFPNARPDLWRKCEQNQGDSVGKSHLLIQLIEPNIGILHPSIHPSLQLDLELPVEVHEAWPVRQ